MYLSYAPASLVHLPQLNSTFVLLLFSTQQQRPGFSARPGYFFVFRLVTVRAGPVAVATAATVSRQSLCASHSVLRGKHSYSFDSCDEDVADAGWCSFSTWQQERFNWLLWAHMGRLTKQTLTQILITSMHHICKHAQECTLNMHK